MIRHLKFPKTLYRLQNTLRFRMREGTSAIEEGRTNYDYLINQHGLYLPRTSIKTDTVDFRHNGVQFYSMSDTFKEIITGNLKEGAPRYYYVIEIPEGTEVPESTVLFQDPVENFVYWLETDTPSEPKEFNSKIQLLLLRNKIHRKKQFKPLFIDSKPTSVKIVQPAKNTLNIV